MTEKNSGTVCATEINRQFCPTSGESGSSLMVKNQNMRLEVEWLKGNRIFETLLKGSIFKVHIVG